MMTATMQDIEAYYANNKDKFLFYFLKRINPSHAPRAEELSQEVFLALVYAAREQIPLSTLNMYAWGVARNKLKMLYRSKDWKNRKTLWWENISPQSYDEDALCALMDGDRPNPNET